MLIDAYDRAVGLLLRVALDEDLGAFKHDSEHVHHILHRGIVK